MQKSTLKRLWKGTVTIIAQFVFVNELFYLSCSPESAKLSRQAQIFSPLSSRRSIYQFRKPDRVFLPSPLSRDSRPVELAEIDASIHARRHILFLAAHNQGRAFLIGHSTAASNILLAFRKKSPGSHRHDAEAVLKPHYIPP